MKSFKDFCKEQVIEEATLAAAVEQAKEEGDLEPINKKIKEIEKIQNSCEDPDKKQSLENALKKFKEILSKFQKKFSIVTEAEPAQEQDDDDQEDDYKELWANAEERAKEVDDAVKSINIIISKDNDNITNDNARYATNKLLKDLLGILNGDTSTLSKAANFINIAAKSKGEPKALTLKELVSCFNTAKKEGVSSASLTSKDIASPKFKTGLIVGLGILLLKKHAGSPDFTIQGMAKDSEYAGDKVLGEVSNSFSNINIDNSLKEKIGLQDISKSDTFIKAVETFVDKLFEGKLVNSKLANTENISKTNPKVEPDETSQSKTNPENISKADPEEKSSEISKADPEEKSSETSSNENKNYKLFSLNSKSSPEEINNAVKEFFGDGDKSKLEHFLTKVEMQKSENVAVGQERKDYNLENLAKYKRDHEDVEDNGNNVSENYVLNTLYNNPLIYEGFKNFVRNVHSNLPTVGRFKVGNYKSSEKSWEACISRMKEAQAEYEKKAVAISGKATSPNCSIPQKHSLLTKLKSLAGEYNIHLNGIFEQCKKRNGYNAIGSAIHDAKSGWYKQQIDKFEKSKDTNAYREKLISKENIKKAISNLSTEELDKITSMGGIKNKYLFAYGILSVAKNNRKGLFERDIVNGKGNVEKGLKNILDNNTEAFGVDADTNLYDFADMLFNSNKDIQKWVEENSKQYETRLRIDPLSDELRLLQSQGKAWLEKTSQQQRSGADFKKEFGINESVSSISFKEFCVLYEAEQTEQPTQSQGQGQPTPEPLCKNDKDKSILATLFLINNNSSDTAREAAAKYLASKNEDKKGYTVNDYLTAAKTYREDNASDNTYVDLCNFFNKLLTSPGNNGQPQQPVQATQGQQPQQPQQTGASQPNINDISTQNDDSETGAGVEPADNNYSVATPQATVTTGAVGDCKIPDRLYRKIIRRKINSFV